MVSYIGVLQLFHNVTIDTIRTSTPCSVVPKCHPLFKFAYDSGRPVLGWYLRKSVKMGPLRLNFSKSGIGYSFGVKGARIGTGPRGPYVAGGRYGIYYRQSLKTPAHPAQASTAPILQSIVPASPNEYCTHCGAAILPGNQFCIQCGTAVLFPVETHDYHLSWWLVVGGTFVAILLLRLLGS